MRREGVLSIYTGEDRNGDIRCKQELPQQGGTALKPTRSRSVTKPRCPWYAASISASALASDAASAPRSTRERELVCLSSTPS